MEKTRNRTILIYLGCLLLVLGRTALAAPETIMEFGVFTDVHNGLTNYQSRYCTQGTNKLADIVAVFNASNLPMAVVLGDLVDAYEYANGVHDDVYQSLEDINAVYQTYTGARHYVMGNHDIGLLTKAEYLEITHSNPHYSFDTNGLHFIVLDTQYNADDTNAEAGNFLWNELYMSTAEMTWLQADLQASSLMPTYIFTHVNLNGSGGESLVNAPSVRNILENNGNVQAVFQGHRHSGSYTFINGIHYKGFQAVVENGYPTNAYAIVSIIDDGTIVINGFGTQEDEQFVCSAFPSVIEATAGNGGTIEPIDNVYVEANADTNFMIMATDYFRIVQVLVDGTNKGPIAGYTFSNVVSGHTIHADFAENLAANSTPHWWLAEMNPSWTNDFDGAETNDADEDGMLTWQEYIAGTHPTNKESVFKVLDVEFQDGSTRLSWLSSSNRIYEVFRSTNLQEVWPEASVTNNMASDPSGTNTWTENETNERGFYRLRVTKP